MTDWKIALPATILIIVASAFFVIIEFSLLSARRHRLEEQAETSRTARAGLRSLNELTVMLAAAQLGITAATFALGAITKPWVHQLLMPLFNALPISQGVADVLAFLVSLFIVTFLHLVIGEMAPKSWAIAHPESAIKVIAIPARWFVNIFRPLLQWINNMANKLVRMAGQEPVDRAAAKGYDAQTLRHLVAHSVDAGTLDESTSSNIQGIIAMETAKVGDAVRDYGSTLTYHPVTVTVAEVQRLARRDGFLRILIDGSTSTVGDGSTASSSGNPAGSAIPMVVHVRDTVLADPEQPALELAHPALVVTGDMAVKDVLDVMRDNSEQLVIVIEGHTPISIITWDDIMNRLWPEIEQEMEHLTK